MNPGASEEQIMNELDRKIREALQSALASRPDLQKRVVVDVDPLNVL